MSAQMIAVPLREIKGIGERTEERLKDAGISSALELAACLPDEVAGALGGNGDSAALLIRNARACLVERGLLAEEFVPASEMLERRNRIRYCTMGSKALDELLGGGIETQAVTELFGAYGSGKSQICHTISVLCQLPLEKEGFDGSAIYVDTEGTFRPNRLMEIAESRGLDRKVLDNVLYCRALNVPHLELAVRSLSSYVEKCNVKLIVVDSVINLYRSEFIGRENLADRQQRLNMLVHKLHNLAEVYDLAVVMTNQIQSTPNTFAGDPNRPTGGNILGHGSTYRIYLKKSGDERVAVIVDSPCHPYSEAKFRITGEGISDVEEKRGRGG